MFFEYQIKSRKRIERISVYSKPELPCQSNELSKGPYRSKTRTSGFGEKMVKKFSKTKTHLGISSISNYTNIKVNHPPQRFASPAIPMKSNKNSQEKPLKIDYSLASSFEIVQGGNLSPSIRKGVIEDSINLSEMGVEGSPFSKNISQSRRVENGLAIGINRV